MIIRMIEPGEHSEWLRMRRALWPACSDSMHALEMKEYNNCAGARVVLVVEVSGDRLGGFVELSIRDRVDGSTSDRVAYVEAWYVDPAYRGRGVGRRLMQQAEQWTVDHGLTELASDAEIDNEGGVRAHKALGFKETFRLTHFLKTVRSGI